jgi:hypothetical protein
VAKCALFFIRTLNDASEYLAGKELECSMPISEVAGGALQGRGFGSKGAGGRAEGLKLGKHTRPP